MQHNQYCKIAKFINEANNEDFRTFFLDMLRLHPEETFHVISYGDAPWMAEVMDQLRDSKKINAIKVYRQHTGLSLRESKDAVEAIVLEYFPLWGK